MKFIKQINEYYNGEYSSFLYAITIDSEETIEQVIGRHFAADRNLADYSPTGRWYANKGRVIDKCCEMYLIRQTAFLDV